VLLGTPAAVRFVSAEPLLGPLDLRPWLERLDWVIVGGESGRNARPMSPDWARSIREHCVSAGVPAHFKQWGEFRDGRRMGKRAAGRVLDGRTWDEEPQRRT
jgi:protein gp37